VRRQRQELVAQANGLLRPGQAQLLLFEVAAFGQIARDLRESDQLAAGAA
jgi:hypothetical protein